MSAEQFSLAMQISVAEREIVLRERVYPGLVKQKRMTSLKARTEIDGMKAIAATLRKLLDERQR